VLRASVAAVAAGRVRHVGAVADERGDPALLHVSVVGCDEGARCSADVRGVVQPTLRARQHACFPLVIDHCPVAVPWPPPPHSNAQALCAGHTRAMGRLPAATRSMWQRAVELDLCDVVAGRNHSAGKGAEGEPGPDRHGKSIHKTGLNVESRVPDVSVLRRPADARRDVQRRRQQQSLEK
jgi:hypothetical protein